MGALYSHTTRSNGTILTATIYNGDHQNHIDNGTPQQHDDYSTNATQMQTSTDPGGVGSESLATSLAGELERLRFVIKTLHGGAQWYPGQALSPALPVIDTTELVKGSADATKKLRFEVDGLTTGTTRVLTPPDYDHRIMSQTHGADIASAATINLDTATGDLVDVTGTTTITAITLTEGKTATVRFTGALILTHGASLVLPGALNITTAVGDFAIFRGYAAGVVRCVIYQAASGNAVVPAGLVKLTSGTVSAAATLDIVMTAYTAYRNKLFVFQSFIPVTDSVSLYFRTSTDGGSTYAAGASNYRYSGLRVVEAGTVTGTGSGGATQIALSLSTIVNSAGFGASGAVVLYDTINTAMRPRVTWEMAHNQTTEGWTRTTGMGEREVAEDTDAFRILFSSGNISSGTWTLYGWN